MKKKIFTLKLIIIILIIPVILLSGHNDSFLKETSRRSPLKNSSDASIKELQNTFHKIYQLYKDSVVFIHTEKTIYYRFPFSSFIWGDDNYKPRSRTFRGQGTGFIISSDGYICTNYHVVKKSDKVLVAINGKKYKARVIGFDPVRDIALLKIKRKGKFKPVYFGNSKNVKVGDFAIAIGNPYGLDKTYTFGVISATGRRSVDPEANSHIQTDASINKGNSGGPLLNIDGEVIGINRAIFSRSGGNIGLGFAIPINSARKILITLKKHGRIFMSYMGIAVRKLSRRSAQSMGIKFKRAWYVYGVYRYSPALKAGIKRGDLILSINDKKIHTYRDLIRNIRKAKAGKVLKVKVWREGYIKYLYPRLKSMPLGRYKPLLF